MEKSGVGYLGVVQVPLRQMQFMEEVGERLHDTRQTERLQALFQNTAADHENYRHWVDGYIDNTEVSSFVNKLGLSRQELKQHNLDGNYPRLDDQVVCFTQGRHRIEAASNINPYDLWTVRLSCMSLSQIQTNQIVKSRTEQYQHETPDSDGRIYSKLREYGDRGLEFHEWHQRLSKKKQYIFRRITQRCTMVEALDLLIQLPGVLDFLQLGCYGTVFDNRLFEECITGWNLIFAEWSKFTLGSRLLRSSIDRDTVVALEGRAPAASEADREWIHQAFTSGQVWSRITDPQQRCELESRVQSTTVIIPGLRWLQGNLLYLNIAARIIWKLIIPEKEGRKAERKKLSLQQILQSYWVASESKSCVEIQEGVFQPVHGPASFNLAYNQLMLAALRQFPYLSKPDPKGKSGEKLGLSLDLNCISLFHKRAALLGFRSSVIQQGVAIVRPPFQPREWTTGKDSTSFNEVKFFSQMYHRWGKPHVHVFRVIQTSAFLPKLTRARSHSEVDITYVLQDLLRTFVKPCSFDCDLSGRCIYLNVGVEALQYHSAVVGTRPANCHTRNAGLQTIEEASESSNNNRYGPDYLTCTQPEPISTAFMHDHVRRRDGIITRGGTATSSYVSYDGERGTRPGPLEPQRHRNSYRSSATKGQRELLRQPLVVGRHSFGMRDILERQSWLVEQGRRIMSSDESSSFENSTCSRSALPSPPVSSQEYHAVEHLSDEFRQPSFGVDLTGTLAIRSLEN
ncbi:hypothetical protein VFPPC_18426 [Pochonia chlamydosporia 170]|uniref:Uncharacterized protein n=1 Tax=Pochonia chlamydosporia 170 TaxID=1380566 RepID=A0A219ANY4_METCM|nr:hypothetical protein VFPPC_18426 [Pochonia chlamydosporia 170]OWT42272.1 hypothetical protein VFPPC_18426 [Pochonia chlamydosporia 170]